MMEDQQFCSILNVNSSLDAALRRCMHMQEPVANTASVARVLARLTLLPRQRQRAWRLPGILLDWQFAPAWPRVAALVGCALIGFVIGIADPDSRIEAPNGPFTVVSQSDVASVVFEPESPAGAWP